MRSRVRQALSTFAAAAGMIALPALLAAQQPAGVTVSGRVVSETGAPLPAVQVFVPELNTGTQSREDGRYSFVIPAARATGQTVTLSARLVGYRPQSAQVTLTPGSTVARDFTLPVNPLRLSEVVVTGAGTVSTAEKLGNVRNAVDSSSIVRSNEPNIVQALAAKAPNVEVTQTGGEPGASSFIRIRGTRTFTSSGQPLFVVDGVPIDNSAVSTTNFNPVDGLGTGEIEGGPATNRAADLNPNDIENIEILKGAAAGAIYGARAGQGVILVTTKAGRAGATRYSLHSSYSWDDINHTYPLQRRYGQGLFGTSPAEQYETATNAEACVSISLGYCTRSWGPDLSGTGTPTYDHSDEAYVIGHISDNTLAVSGGNDRTTFYLSGAYLNQRGIFEGPNNEFVRSTIRLKATQRIADAFTVGGNVAYADTRSRYIERGNNTNGLQLGLLRTPPDFNNHPYLDPVSRTQRSYRFQSPQPNAIDAVADRGFNNPFYTLHVPENTQQVGRVFGNVNAEYEPLNWLKLNYVLGADYASDERLEGAAKDATSPEVGGRVTEGKIVNYNIDHNLTATATYSLSQNLGGSFTLGQNLSSRNYHQLSQVGRTLVADRPFRLSNTVSLDPSIDLAQLVRSEAYFGQATLDLFEQLYLTAAARNDGSSTFDKDHQRAWFPKASAAWTLTKYLGEQPWLTFGKLRLAYGETGTEPIAYLTSQQYSLFALTTISQGVGLTPTQAGFGGLNASFTLASQTLKPERTKEFEAGFDIGLVRDRADVSFTYYNSKTDDVIIPLTIATSTGFGRQFQQGAKFSNKGLEVALNLRPVTTASFGWDVGLQWAKNTQRVDQLLGASYVALNPSYISPGAIAQPGSPVGVFYDFGWARCGLSPGGLGTVIPDVDLDQVCAGQPRGATYIGEDGFPVADNNQRIVGDPNPKWTGSVRSGLRVKKWQLSGLLDIKKGGSIYNGTKGALYSYGTHKDTERRAVCDASGECTGNERVFGQGGWYNGPVVGPGVGIAVPIGENWYRQGLGTTFTGYSEAFIEDGGYVKLRELSAAYTMDTPWVKRTLGLSSVDLRLAARNLKTWTRYSGYDPETNLGQGQNNGFGTTLGLDYFNQPQTRSFVFSLGLNR